MVPLVQLPVSRDMAWPPVAIGELSVLFPETRSFSGALEPVLSYLFKGYCSSNPLNTPPVSPSSRPVS